jgi:tetratricopeptide (TPR) repeat protein
MAQAMAEECLEIAEQINETEMLLQAHYALGVIYQWRGELVRAREALEWSLALCQHQQQALTSFYGGQNPQVSILRRMALVLWYLGYPEQALTWKQEALQMARELGQPYDLLFASYYAIMAHLERGDGRVAQECADGLVSLANERGFAHFLPVGALYRGAALIVQG